MSYARSSGQLSTWGIPALYAATAIIAGLTFPRIESRLFPEMVTKLSVSAAMAMYSAIASGMIALTGIVFSLAFVMVQFSATAYSPRLVLWIARDRVMSHALGVFTATFLYAIAALAGVDRSGSGKVPAISAWVVVALLLASVGMFIALIHRIGLLQVNRMLIFTGDQGRRVITTLYPAEKPLHVATGSAAFRDSACTQSLIHRGRPRSIQTVNVDALVHLAKESGGVIEMLMAVGDTVVERLPVLHVFGAVRTIDEKRLRSAIALGAERTFDQDPKYAIRLLVDIAIKALSPAVNDPTTAVQSLDQIQDLLLRMGCRHLEIGEFCDEEDKLRLVLPFPAWDDILQLAFDEIRAYGATSVQVMRRMNALVNDLITVLPEARLPALRHWDFRLKNTITHSFTDLEDRQEASREDRQGLGMPRDSSANSQVA